MADLNDLYAGPYGDFVQRRKALARTVRDRGELSDARTIEALRKPTRGAWLINLLSRAESGEVSDYLALGPAMARAHADADMAALRRLSADRTAAIASLVRIAERQGQAQGYRATAAVLDEVGETLAAALTDPELAARVAEGVVVAPARAAGFGPLSGGFVPAGSTPPAAPNATPAPTESGGESALGPAAPHENEGKKEALAEVPDPAVGAGTAVAATEVAAVAPAGVASQVAPEPAVPDPGQLLEQARRLVAAEEAVQEIRRQQEAASAALRAAAEERDRAEGRVSGVAAALAEVTEELAALQLREAALLNEHEQAQDEARRAVAAHADRQEELEESDRQLTVREQELAEARAALGRGL